MFGHHHRGLSAATFLVLAALAAFGTLVPAVSAGAAPKPGTGYELTPGWFVLGGTATCKGSPARHLNSTHAAAFIQSWYFASLYGTLTEQKPPASLPKCTFVGQERINGGSFQFHAFYVSQGKKAWVGLPKQVIGPGAFVPVAKWYVAPPRATQAWLGNLELPPNTTTTTTTTPAVVEPSGSSGSSAPWIIAVVAGVALVGAGAVVVRNRRRAAPS